MIVANIRAKKAKIMSIMSGNIVLTFKRIFIKFIMVEKNMISIIGAGPVGSYTAYLLAKAGRDVKVFEEHRSIGSPIQCAGILPSTVTKFVSMNNDFILNKIDRFKIYSPNDSVEIELKEENYVVDREMFDNYLAEKSMNVGVKYFLGRKLKEVFDKELVFDCGRDRTDILIGADGPTSIVAHKTGLYYGRRFAVGMQTVVDYESEEDLVKNYVGQGYFGWVIPEDDKRCRIGIIAESNCKQHFNSFLRKLGVNCGSLSSGLVPIHNPNFQICKDHVYLVGDAATQVKATTYGGIVHGFFGAQALAKSILEKKDYSSLCKKNFGRDLKVSLMMRNKLNKFVDKDYDYLVKLVKQDRIKRILSKHERDYAFKIALGMVLKEPRFLKFLFI